VGYTWLIRGTLMTWAEHAEQTLSFKLGFPIEHVGHKFPLNYTTG